VRKRILPTLFLICALGGIPSWTLAQVQQQPLQTEARVDGIFAHTSGVEAGVGVSIPTGIYVRTGLVAGAGVGEHGAEGRTDLLSRFSLDPFRQSRWSLYGGGGMSGRYRTRADGGTHAYLLLFVGLEGPLPLGETAGWVPAVEAGLGGGARIGLILRRGINAHR
jgi:hypothetical protein